MEAFGIPWREERIRTIEEANLILTQLIGLIRDPAPKLTRWQLMQRFYTFSSECAVQGDSLVWQMIMSDAGNYVRVEDSARLKALMGVGSKKAAHIIIPTRMKGLPTVTVVENKAEGMEMQSLQVLLQTDNLQSLDSIPLLLPLRDANWQLFLREKGPETALSFVS